MSENKGQKGPSPEELKAASLMLAKGALQKALGEKALQGARLMPAERFPDRPEGPPTRVAYSEERLAHWAAILETEREAERKRAAKFGGKIEGLERRIKALSA
jgi:hypothetical protein